MYAKRESLKFSRWLRNKIVLHDKTVSSMAIKLHMDKRTIYRHLNATVAPTFAMVVAYCWYFNDGDDPINIWNLIGG